MVKYLFDIPLKEGLILKRPNRFLIDVLVDNKITPTLLFNPYKFLKNKDINLNISYIK